MDTFIGVIFAIVFLSSIGFIAYRVIKRKKDDSCSDGSCDKDKKKDDPCADGSCDKDKKEPVVPVPIEPVKPKEPVNILLTLQPNNTDTKVPAGVFCTRTRSIKAIEEITGNDCSDCVIRQWFDNDVEIIKDKGKLETFPPFTTNHTFKYKVTIGDVSKETTVKIK